MSFRLNRGQTPGQVPRRQSPRRKRRRRSGFPCRSAPPRSSSSSFRRLPAVEERGGIPTASLLREAHPAELSGDTLTLEFPPSAQFHLDLVRDPKNVSLLADALYDVTGRRLELAFELGEARETPATDEEPAGEDKILELLKETFDAQERES